MDISLSNHNYSITISIKKVDVLNRSNVSLPPHKTNTSQYTLPSNSDNQAAVDADNAPTATQNTSYLDKLQSNIIQTDITISMQHHAKSYETHMSDEIDCPISGATFVPLTIEDKKRIYQKGSKAIIVKVYGKTVGYRLIM